MKDYYQILGLTKDTDETNIKKAYKKLAFQYHPDKNKSDDAETTFREISEAYDILSDDNKRQEYDYKFNNQEHINGIIPIESLLLMMKPQIEKTIDDNGKVYQFFE